MVPTFGYQMAVAIGAIIIKTFIIILLHIDSVSSLPVVINKIWDLVKEKMSVKEAVNWQKMVSLMIVARTFLASNISKQLPATSKLFLIR